MKTPTNLTPAKAFQANPQPIVSFLLVGLTLALALAITMTFNRPKESVKAIKF